MKRIFPSALLAMCLALLVGACKSDPKTENAAWKRTTSDVILRLENNPDRLNPLLSTSGYGSQVNNQIFQFLMSVNPQTLELIPQLLKSKPTATDITEGTWKGGVAYAMEIHDKAMWDNGTPVTANDYAFSLKAVLNPLVDAPRVRAFIDIIRDVQVDAANPKKFTVFVSEKHIIGEEKICGAFPVMPEYLYDPKGLLKSIPLQDLTTPAKAEELAKAGGALKAFADEFQSPKYSNEKEFIGGSGPYRLESWESGQRVVLVKKSNWWAQDMADSQVTLESYPDRLVYQVITEVTTAIQALRNEEIDAMSDIDPLQWDSLRNNAGMKDIYNFHTPLMLTNFLIYVNTRNPKVSDKRVRKAIAHALDLDVFIKTIFNGLGQKAVGPVHPSAEYFNSDLKPMEHNVNLSRQLLGEAGWKDTNGNGTADKQIGGKTVELELEYLYTAGRKISEDAALLLQQQLKQAGITLKLVPKDFNAMLAAQRSGEYELCSGGRALSPTLWEPNQSWSTTQDNRTGFGNAETDALINQIQVTLDKKQRNDLYKKLQAIIYDEQPEIYLMVPTGRLAIHKRFQAEPSSLHPGYFPNQFNLVNQ